MTFWDAVWLSDWRAQLRNCVLHGRALRRHLANTIKRFVRCGDAGL